MPARNDPLVAVVGGGASGMAAALFALRGGARVALLEKNEKLGKKLYITGKGRCNVTNACDAVSFLSNVPRNPRFLHSALAFLSPENLRELLSGLGCETAIERGGRVFPASGKASDVTRAFVRGLTSCDLRLNAGVSGLLTEGGAVRGVSFCDGSVLPADAVILATGGWGYPQTGSTGDGYRFAEQAGHRVCGPLPSLVPLEASDPWIPAVQGLSLKHVVLSASRGGREFFAEQGEMLFTHFGVSGPLVLSLSSAVAGMEPRSLGVRIDLKPALTLQQVEARLSAELAAGGGKLLRGLLPGFMPGSLAAVFPQICGVDGGKRCGQVSSAERGALASAMKGIPLSVTGPRPLSEAVVTRGGVDVGGLYFAGELIDVDAYTGGFNLHIAFATGALAGHSAAQKP